MEFAYRPEAWEVMFEMVALAAVTLAGWITPALLLGFTFLIGCGHAAFAPAWQASIGDQVPRAQIASAIMAKSSGVCLLRILNLR